MLNSKGVTTIRRCECFRYFQYVYLSDSYCKWQLKFGYINFSLLFIEESLEMWEIDFQSHCSTSFQPL